VTAVLFLASSLNFFSVNKITHELTAALSLTKFCINVYFDKILNIKVKGQGYMGFVVFFAFAILA